MHTQHEAKCYCECLKIKDIYEGMNNRIKRGHEEKTQTTPDSFMIAPLLNKRCIKVLVKYGSVFFFIFLMVLPSWEEAGRAADAPEPPPRRAVTRAVRQQLLVGLPQGGDRVSLC